VKFTKMHGCGDDFVVVEGAADELAGPADYVFEGSTR